MLRFLFLFVLLVNQFSYSQEHISVHQRDKEQFGQKEKPIVSVDESREEIIPLVIKSTTSLNKSVFGFLPDWEYPTAKFNLRYDLLTHIAAFDFAVSSSGVISNPSGWPWTDVINTAHTNGVKIIMAITNFNKDGIRTILTNTTVKNTFFANIKTKIQTYNLDGVNIDFEGPYTADRGSLMNGFMADLTNYVHTNLPGKEVSFDGPVVNWSGWDFVGLANSCDYIFIMGYDFNGSWSTTTGPSSPLSGGTYNVGNSLTSTSWGYGNVVASNPGKLILGIPYYGDHWTTQTSAANSTVISFISSTRFKDDYLNSLTYGRIWQSSYQVPWYRYQQSSTWHQKWYDDDQSLGLKYDQAISKSLKGVGMWALGYDGTRQELWDLLRNRFYSEVPVEFTSFSAIQNETKIKLSWTTATETNNMGFEILRTIAEEEPAWEKVGFINGHGTTTEPSNYVFYNDISDVNSKKVNYRLKQIDTNGSYNYSDIIEVELTPFKFYLSQNFPNPFNPATRIDFQLPTDEFISIKVFDLLGNDVENLYEGMMNSGFHRFNIDGSKLTTGVYFYKLSSKNFNEVKKMMLVR